MCINIFHIFSTKLGFICRHLFLFSLLIFILFLIEFYFECPSSISFVFQVDIKSAQLHANHDLSRFFGPVKSEMHNPTDRCGKSFN